MGSASKLGGPSTRGLNTPNIEISEIEVLEV